MRNTRYLAKQNTLSCQVGFTMLVYDCRIAEPKGSGQRGGVQELWDRRSRKKLQRNKVGEEKDFGKRIQDLMAKFKYYQMACEVVFA